jgi:hypothetical protein
VCDQCRREEYESAETTALPTPAKQASESRLVWAIRAQRCEFVIQLVAERGPFWEAIRNLRGRWQVAVARRVPDSWPFTDLYPRPIPEESWDSESPDYSEESSRAWDKFLEEWYDNLGSVVEQLVPEKLRRRPTSPGWQEFVAACTLYQPPDAELRKFADWGMPGESIIMHPSPSTDTFERRGMVLPPIRQLPDPHEERMLVARYWQEIL